jgi:SAM-dependent methyltransferase
MACQQAGGEVIIELDHDDLLMPRAVEAVKEAFRSPSTTFVYSNNAAVDDDWSPREFAANHGWQYRDVCWSGRPLRECVAPEPWPQNLSRIWYAPDHLRAWRAEAYWLAGGHDQELAVADDHDLICRMYLSGNFAHLDECLYIYRADGRNNSILRNEEIQTAQWKNYDRYSVRLARRWAEDCELKVINIEGQQYWEDKDWEDKGDQSPAVSSINRLNGRWPFETDSVGVIIGSDAFQYLKNPVHTMNEAWRVLAHGGFLFVRVPSTDGRGAFENPLHRSYWNQNSFGYYTRGSMRRHIEPLAKGRFQEIRVQTTFPNDYCRLHNIPFVQADLVAVKDGPRFHGFMEN